MRMLRFIAALVAVLGVIGGLSSFGSATNKSSAAVIIWVWLLVLGVVYHYEKQAANPKIEKEPVVGYRTKSVIRIILAVVAGLVFLSGGVLLYESTHEQEEETASQTADIADTNEISTDTLFFYMNKERERAGLPPLKRLAALDLSAQRKADTIVTEGNYAHKDLNGVQGALYIEDFTDICTYGGENIINKSQDSLTTIRSWMTSDSHKDAILDERYEYTGFGLRGGFAVQHFCDID